MLSRIRVEAEGTTIDVCQRDIFATFDALSTLAYGAGVVTPLRLTDEVYELKSDGELETGAGVIIAAQRWYKGRAVVIVPTGSASEIASDRLRDRISWLDFCDQISMGMLPTEQKETAAGDAELRDKLTKRFAAWNRRITGAWRGHTESSSDE